MVPSHSQPLLDNTALISCLVQAYPLSSTSGASSSPQSYGCWSHLLLVQAALAPGPSRWAWLDHAALSGAVDVASLV